MITVNILINGNAIYARSARNVKNLDTKGLCLYEVDDGRQIKHNRSKGAVELAIKMLKGIEKP